MMATHPFRYSVQKPWSHSKILFSLKTTHPIQCEILLALPSIYIQTISHHLHCYHPGPRHHHYSPGYYVSLLLVCSLLSLFYLETNGDLHVTVLLKALQWLSHFSQSKIKGSDWPTRPRVIWPPVTSLTPRPTALPLASLPQSITSLAIPGAWPALSCFRTFAYAVCSAIHVLTPRICLTQCLTSFIYSLKYCFLDEADHLLNQLPSAPPQPNSILIPLVYIFLHYFFIYFFLCYRLPTLLLHLLPFLVLTIV